MIAKAHNIDLVMLDFDGTLVDSALDIYHAVSELLAGENCKAMPFEVVKVHIGEGFMGLVEDAFPAQAEDEDFKEKMYQKFLQIYERHYLNNVVLFPGVLEFLAAWEGTLAIVSNKPERFVTRMVSATKLKTFNWLGVLGGDSCARSKPHPDSIEFVLNKAQVDPRRAALVGDGLQDVGAAQAAGVHGIAVDYGYVTKAKLMAAGATHFVSSLTDLPQTFMSLRG